MVPYFVLIPIWLSCVAAREAAPNAHYWSPDCWTTAQNAEQQTSIHYVGDHVVLTGPVAGHRQELRVPKTQAKQVFGCVTPFGDAGWLLRVGDYGSFGYLWRDGRWVAVDPILAVHPDAQSDEVTANLFAWSAGDARLVVQLRSDSRFGECSASLSGVGDPEFRMWWVGLDRLEIEGERQRHLVRVVVTSDPEAGILTCKLAAVAPESGVTAPAFLEPGPTDRFSQYPVRENWNRPPD